MQKAVHESGVCGLLWKAEPNLENSNLIATYAAVEATRREMWGGRDPDPAEAEQLARCFEYEWHTAVTTMLKHWPKSPTWY